MNLGACLVGVVKSLPFGWISAVLKKIKGYSDLSGRVLSKKSYQIVINMDGIVEHGSPVEGSVSLNLVSKAFCVGVCLPVEAIAIAPSRWGVQVEINRVSNQMVWVGCWWNNGATDILTFSSESMGDPDGDLKNSYQKETVTHFQDRLLSHLRPIRTANGAHTWALSGKTVHFVHFRFEALVNLDSESIVSLDSCWTVSDQVATAGSTATTGGATALSGTWSATEATLISTGWTFVCIVLAFATLVSASFVVVAVFSILALSIAWLTASNITCTTAKTSLPTSSAKIVIPVQAGASNTSTLGIWKIRFLKSGE